MQQDSSPESIDQLVANVNKQIRKGSPQIEKCRGKDLIVLVGPTGAGKTTTYAAVMYGPLKQDDSGNWSAKHHLPEGGKPVLPEIGDGLKGVSTTTLPQGSGLKDSEVILDTMGVFHTNGDIHVELASSSILGMCLKLSRSVRVVCVENHSDYVKGIRGLVTIGQIWSDLFTEPSVPMLFLFNQLEPKLPPDKRQWMKFELRLDDLEDERRQDDYEEVKREMNAFAVELIMRQFEKIKEGADDILRAHQIEIEKIRACGVEEGELSQEEIEKQAKIRYVQLMEHNFDKNNVCYFDPTSMVSIALFLEKVRSLETVPIEKLNHSKLCDKVDPFKKQILSRLDYFSKILQGYILSRRFNHDLIRRRKEELEQRKREKDEEISGFDKDYNDSGDDEVIRRGGQLQEMLRDYQERIRRLTAEVERLRNEIREIEEGDPVLIKEYDINGRGWTPICRIDYNEGVPFVRVEERPGEGTMKTQEIINDGPHARYEAEFGSTSFRKWYVVGGTLAILAGVGYVMVCTPAGPALLEVAKKALNMEELGKICTEKTKKEIVKIVSKPVAASFTTGGVVVHSIPKIRQLYYDLGCSNISGCVRFYAQPKDIPRNKEKIRDNKTEIEKLNAEIEELQKGEKITLEALEKVKCACAKKEKLDTFREAFMDKKRKIMRDIEYLENWLRFINVIEALYEANRAVIEEYRFILPFLFDTPQSAREVCDFTQCLDDLESVASVRPEEIEPDMLNSKVSSFCQSLNLPHN